jgi:formate/nitrite transporter FocA (FNT family)
MKYLKVLVSAIMSGMCIGFGGAVFLSVDSKLVGAIFFTLGLFTICANGLQLYTGKVCYFFRNDTTFKINIPIIWIGNLIGTGLTAFCLSCTRVYSGIQERAAALCEIKNTDSYLSLFVLGILCNIMIFIAVEGYNKIPHEVGKYLALFLGVVVFILAGFEHSIADMFYYWAGAAWSVNGLIRVLVITAGNAVGGIVFTEVLNWLKTSKD